jgi:hypothetical protein
MEAVWVAATEQPQLDRESLTQSERGSLQERAAALSFYEESFYERHPGTAPQQ